MPGGRELQRCFFAALLLSTTRPGYNLDQFQTEEYGFLHMMGVSVNKGFRRMKTHKLLGVNIALWCHPHTLRLVKKLKRNRRFWTAPRGPGFWEKDVRGTWVELGNLHADWEDVQYLQRYRMTKATFWYLYRRYGWRLEKERTKLRNPIAADKRFAITIHWLAHSSSFSELAVLYRVAKSTVVSIVHEGVDTLRHWLVPESILFPTGEELTQVISDFEALCGLPQCGGALDGTFMQIRKPSEFGDTYYCYKRFHSIIILGCVDARGIFTSVNSGRPGSVGDSYTFRHSQLKINIENDVWLSPDQQKMIGGVNIRPFLVADSAFPLQSTIMKCFEGDHHVGRESSFNYSVIRTRRVVEQAFGRLKGRWQVTSSCNLNDPIFARETATVCCALHNVCERYNCPFEDNWLPNEADYAEELPAHLHHLEAEDNAQTVRDTLANWIHDVYPRH